MSQTTRAEEEVVGVLALPSKAQSQVHVSTIDVRIPLSDDDTFET